MLFEDILEELDFFLVNFIFWDFELVNVKYFVYILKEGIYVFFFIEIMVKII